MKLIISPSFFLQITLEESKEILSPSSKTILFFPSSLLFLQHHKARSNPTSELHGSSNHKIYKELSLNYCQRSKILSGYAPREVKEHLQKLIHPHPTGDFMVLKRIRKLLLAFPVIPYELFGDRNQGNKTP